MFHCVTLTYTRNASFKKLKARAIQTCYSHACFVLNKQISDINQVSLSTFSQRRSLERGKKINREVLWKIWFAINPPNKNPGLCQMHGTVRLTARCKQNWSTQVLKVNGKFFVGSRFAVRSRPWDAEAYDGRWPFKVTSSLFYSIWQGRSPRPRLVGPPMLWEVGTRSLVDVMDSTHEPGQAGLKSDVPNRLHARFKLRRSIYWLTRNKLVLTNLLRRPTHLLIFWTWIHFRLFSYLLIVVICKNNLSVNEMINCLLFGAILWAEWYRRSTITHAATEDMTG